jgi:hypothetical protein
MAATKNLQLIEDKYLCANKSLALRQRFFQLHRVKLPFVTAGAEISTGLANPAANAGQLGSCAASGFNIAFAPRTGDSRSARRAGVPV